jgi:hypothetical protein
VLIFAHFLIRLYNRFVELKGVDLLKKWLEEAKTKEKEEIMLSIMKIILKLPLTLDVLTSSGIGKSLTQLKKDTSLSEGKLIFFSFRCLSASCLSWRKLELAGDRTSQYIINKKRYVSRVPCSSFFQEKKLEFYLNNWCYYASLRIKPTTHATNTRKQAMN